MAVLPISAENLNYHPLILRRYINIIASYYDRTTTAKTHAVVVTAFSFLFEIGLVFDRWFLLLLAAKLPERLLDVAEC